MNRDELLTKLAMELAVWPELSNDAYLPQGFDYFILFGHGTIVNYIPTNYTFTRHVWKERRRELINEPDDNDAPEWAIWVAQDKNADWHWFECKPILGHHGMFEVSRAYRATIAGHGNTPRGHAWYETLRRVKREKNSINRTAADGVNTETLHQDGMITSTMVHKPDTSEYEKAQFYESRIDTIGQNGGDGLHYDSVDHPKHYASQSIECIYAIKWATADKSGIEAVCVANVIKYVWRYDKKGGIESLKKARWYLDRLIDEVGDE